VSARGVDSLTLKVDTAKLEAFQNTLKGASARGMNEFINRLNTLDALNAQAQKLRSIDMSASITPAPSVG
jgi:nitrate reductase assembly molybdenum cofactor insertion protein NarJ